MFGDNSAPSGRKYPIPNHASFRSVNLCSVHDRKLRPMSGVSRKQQVELTLEKAWDWGFKCEVEIINPSQFSMPHSCPCNCLISMFWPIPHSSPRVACQDTSASARLDQMPLHGPVQTSPCRQAAASSRTDPATTFAKCSLSDRFFVRCLLVGSGAAKVSLLCQFRSFAFALLCSESAPGKDWDQGGASVQQDCQYIAGPGSGSCMQRSEAPLRRLQLLQARRMFQQSLHDLAENLQKS